MLVPAQPAASAPVGQGAWAIPAASVDSLVVQVQRRGAARRGGAAYRGGAVVRGGAAYRGGAAVRRGGAVYRGGTVVRRGGAVAWRRPSNYWWRPGAAVAAGAAIGFVSAATAAAWAGAAPAPGYCWYYTDPSRTQGFWDACP